MAFPDSKSEQDWEHVIETIQCFVERKLPDDQTLSYYLGTDTYYEYQHYLASPIGIHKPKKLQVLHMLESWRDTQQDQSNLRYCVINILGGAQKHEDCIALVDELTSGLNTAKTETDTPVHQKDESCKIGNIVYYPTKKLGEGSMGTTVFLGKYGRREVAVKMVRQSEWSKKAITESDLLLQVNSNENIVRYFGTEKCSQFIYIALQLCEANLQECVEGKYKNPQVNLSNVLLHVLHGLNFLHNLESPIVHSDIKPSNILIYISNYTSEPIGKLADLGTAKHLRKFHGTSSVGTQFMQGSRGWMAPEMVQAFTSFDGATNHKTDIKVDIFSMGLVISYVCSGGEHPFGDDKTLGDYNITQGKYDFSRLQESKNFLSLNLIEKMIATDPQTRPTVELVLKHPKFWTGKKISSFFIAVNHLIHSEVEGAQVSGELERGSDEVITSVNWVNELEMMVEADNILLIGNKYKAETLSDLIRAICDYSNHYNQPDRTHKSTSGVLHNKFIDYWLLKFPKLLLYTFQAMERYKMQPNLHQFYDHTHNYESAPGTNQISQQQRVVYPDSVRFSTGGSVQHQVSSGSQMNVIDGGQRPSVLQIAKLQNQNTIEDEEDLYECPRKIDEHDMMSPVQEWSRLSPSAEYFDKLGIFAGLRQDYAWCDDTQTSPKKTFHQGEMYPK